MGASMAQAFLRNNLFPPSDLLIVETDDDKRSHLSHDLGCLTQKSAGKELESYGTVILAVKPQVSVTVMQELSAYLQPKHLVLSIMAGITVDKLVKNLKHSAVVRVMPNTPAQIGEGMSVYYATPEVNDDQHQVIKALLSSCGRCLKVSKEDAIDAATAVSGSGPAYVFYFAEQMIASAKNLGFTDEEAKKLSLQTLKGAILLWEHKDIPAAVLRQQVTSPGGTTEAAIRSFGENKVDQHIQEGILRAYQRAKELS